MGEIKQDHQALLYHRDRLRDLKSGMNKVLDIIHGVLCIETCTDDEGNPTKLAEYYESLQRVEKESWGRLKEEFIESDKDWDDADNMESEKTVPQILMEFVKELDEIKTGLEERLNLHGHKESTMIKELSILQEQLYQERQENLEVKWQIREITGEGTDSSVKYSAAFLQQRLKEKQNTIAELQRGSTVQLWGKERNRILETSAKREQELLKELEDLKITHENMKERLLSKVKELEHKSKIEKMKIEITRNTSRDETEKLIESLKRKIFLAERDLKKAEDELFSQQKLVVGCMKGLRSDFRMMMNRRENDNFRTDDIKKMVRLLDAIYYGAVDGRLEITKADLPLHYIALNEDVHGYPGNKKLSTNIGLRKTINRHISAISNDTISSVDDKKRSTRASITRDRVTLSSTPTQNKCKAVKINSKNTSKISTKNAADGTPCNIQTNTEKGNKRENPTLINISNGELDVECTLRCFPGMVEIEVREHHEHYKRYDTNGDYSLDISEMIRAIQSMVGDYYTPQQIKEAMAEIDTDGSQTIDFYEYLTISSKLLKKSGGNAEIFRSNLVRHANASVSRMCAVQ